MNAVQMEALGSRIEKLEKQKTDDLLVLLELMSNATFFGNMKKTDCGNAKDGQCGLFFLENKAKNKLPIATNCRIKKCVSKHEHCHLEISNVTCTFCPQWQEKQILFTSNNQTPNRRKKHV